MMRKMRMLGLMVAALILAFGSCTNSNKGTQSKNVIAEELVNKMKVENVTVQEWISGVQGGTNSIEFKLDIYTVGDDFQPDSIHFQDYQCAIFLRNETTGTYSGKMNKIKGSKLSNESTLQITFKENDERFAISNEQITILKPVHMP